MSDNIAKTRAAILAINSSPIGARKSTEHMPVAQKVSFFAKGGAVNFHTTGKKKFEGSKKDKSEDAKLAKKYDMSLKGWESSKKDVKHDKQKSMKGFAEGGSVMVRGKSIGLDAPNKIQGAGYGRWTKAPPPKSVRNDPTDDAATDPMILALEKREARVAARKESMRENNDQNYEKVAARLRERDAGPDIKVTAYKNAELLKPSFGKAFKDARSGGAKSFEWNGKKYTTERADDKPMSDSAIAAWNKKNNKNYAKGGKVTGSMKREAASIIGALKKVKKPAMPMPRGMAMKHGGKVKC